MIVGVGEDGDAHAGAWWGQGFRVHEKKSGCCAH